MPVIILETQNVQKTSQESRKAAQRTSGCQGVKMFLLKDLLKSFFCHKLRFVIIQVCHNEFFFVTNLIFWFGHNLSFVPIRVFFLQF